MSSQLYDFPGSPVSKKMTTGHPDSSSTAGGSIQNQASILSLQKICGRETRMPRAYLMLEYLLVPTTRNVELLYL